MQRRRRRCYVDVTLCPLRCPAACAAAVSLVSSRPAPPAFPLVRPAGPLEDSVAPLPDHPPPTQPRERTWAPQCVIRKLPAQLRSRRLCGLSGGLAGPGAWCAGPPPASSVVRGGVSRRSWSGRFVPPFRAVPGSSPSLASNACGAEGLERRPERHTDPASHSALTSFATRRASQSHPRKGRSPTGFGCHSPFEKATLIVPVSVRFDAVHHRVATE